jgi:hypothetical protein
MVEREGLSKYVIHPVHIQTETDEEMVADLRQQTWWPPELTDGLSVALRCRPHFVLKLDESITCGCRYALPLRTACPFQVRTCVACTFTPADTPSPCRRWCLDAGQMLSSWSNVMRKTLHRKCQCTCNWCRFGCPAPHPPLLAGELGTCRRPTFNSVSHALRATACLFTGRQPSQACGESTCSSCGWITRAMGVGQERCPVEQAKAGKLFPWRRYAYCFEGEYTPRQAEGEAMAAEEAMPVAEARPDEELPDLEVEKRKKKLRLIETPSELRVIEATLEASSLPS